MKETQIVASIKERKPYRYEIYPCTYKLDFQYETINENRYKNHSL